MKDKLLYTIMEAADQLGVGRTTMYGLINGKQIVPVRIGKRGKRISYEELQRFVRSQEEGG